MKPKKMDTKTVKTFAEAVTEIKKAHSLPNVSVLIHDDVLNMIPTKILLVKTTNYASWNEVDTLVETSDSRLHFEKVSDPENIVWIGLE